MSGARTSCSAPEKAIGSDDAKHEEWSKSDYKRLQTIQVDLSGKSGEGGGEAKRRQKQEYNRRMFFDSRFNDVRASCPRQNSDPERG